MNLKQKFQSVTVEATASLESNAEDGKPTVEKEYVFFVRPENFDEITSNRNWILQEQWEVREGKIPEDERETSERVRYERANDATEPTYTHARKVSIRGKISKLETERPSTEQEFADYKRKATSGCYKKRYLFPTEYNSKPATWEVDVFYTADGHIVPWVKLDLEVDELGHELPAWPFAVAETFVKQVSERTEEEHKWLREHVTSKMFIKR